MIAGEHNKNKARCKSTGTHIHNKVVVIVPVRKNIYMARARRRDIYIVRNQMASFSHNIASGYHLTTNHNHNHNHKP